MTSIALTLGAGRAEDRQDDSPEARFDVLVRTEMQRLYRYAYWLSGDRSTADDLVQDTLVRAWRSIDQLANPAAARGWLLTILRRENARRFERKRPVEAQLPVEAVADQHRDYDTSTEAFVLRRALAALPEDYREPLLLQVIYGYSQQEIAAQLGLTPGGVGSRLFRARQKMRALLEDDA
jgi:RNA polymerase sigma-70 factor (ECF subfamily)